MCYLCSVFFVLTNAGKIYKTAKNVECDKNKKLRSYYTYENKYIMPASLISRVKFAARPENPFFRPLPLATTRLASPWKRLAVTAPGFFSTVSTYSVDVTAIPEPFPAPATKNNLACHKATKPQLAGCFECKTTPPGNKI